MSNLLRDLKMDSLRNALAYARDKQPRFEGELGAFIRFASVSAQPQHADDIAKCAAWLANHLHVVGLEQVQVIPTPRHPVVYADWRRASPGTATVLRNAGATKPWGESGYSLYERTTIRP